MSAPQYHCKKNWSENKSLFRFPIPPTVFSISRTKFMLVTTVFFLNHRGRKKNFDATDGNKFDLSVKKIFPVYWFK